MNTAKSCSLFLRALALCVMVFSCATVSSAAPPSISVLGSDPDAEIQLVTGAGGENCTLTHVPVTGQPFAEALHVDVQTPLHDPWLSQLQVVTAQPVQKGDAILATFYVRALRPLDGSAQITADFETSASPYSKSLIFTLTPGQDWRRIDLPFQAADSYGPGTARFNVMVGHTIQTLEFGGFTLRDFGPSVTPAQLPQMSITYSGREATAPWRRAAQARIEKYRKGNLTILVVDAQDRPVSGADVSVHMTRPAFKFGTAVADDLLLAQGAEADTYRDHMTGLFTAAVSESIAKWPAWNYPTCRAQTQSEMDWLNARHFSVRGHNLVWPGWQYLPTDLHDGYLAHLRQSGPDVAREWLATQTTAHITDEVHALRGKCAEWDVVNEPTDNHDLQDILGSDAISSWFRTAHTADPDARLFLNNDGTFPDRGDDPRFVRLQQTVRSLLKSGAPLGGLGLESHITDYALTSPDHLLRSLNALAQFGLPLEVTEYDFKTPDKKLQADYSRDFLTMMFSHPAITGFLVWGFWDGRHWLGDAPLYNKDWSLKPSGRAMIDLVFHQWRTNASGTTNVHGVYQIRAFLGVYAITVHRGASSKTIILQLTLTNHPAKIRL